MKPGELREVFKMKTELIITGWENVTETGSITSLENAIISVGGVQVGVVSRVMFSDSALKKALEDHRTKRKKKT